MLRESINWIQLRMNLNSALHNCLGQKMELSKAKIHLKQKYLMFVWVLENQVLVNLTPPRSWLLLDLHHPSPTTGRKHISSATHRGPSGISQGSRFSGAVGDFTASHGNRWRPTEPCESASLVPRRGRKGRTAPQLDLSFSWAYFLVWGRHCASLLLKQEPSEELSCAYLLTIEGYQNMPPQNMLLWHLNYFELRPFIENEQMQEKF